MEKNIILTSHHAWGVTHYATSIVRHALCTALFCALTTGCDMVTDVLETVDCPVEAALSLTVSSKSSTTTRMSGDMVQANSNFRGLKDLRAIPFATAGKIISGDRPKAFDTEGISSEEYAKTGARFYYFEDCEFMTGVKSFLVYARAYTATNDEGQPTNKAANGSLVADLPADMSPANISFSPDVIYDADNAPDDGQTIATYLTTIATTSITHQGHTYTWSAAADSRLRAYYLNFTGQSNQSNALIASSTANVQQYVGALRTQINALSYTEGTVEALLRTAILSAINSGYDNLPEDYPASLGLPDGAAAVLWNGTAFAPQTTTTTLANISSIRRYAYPAELYYIANSQIKTSEKNGLNTYYDSESTWNNVLSQYENDNGMITNNTKAVAIKEPLQYAVGCLQVRLNALANASLPDADGNAITVGATTFPLTGIIVGSQRPVGFDFVPLSDSDVDTRFVYDRYPVSASGEQFYLNTTGSSTTTNTLVLQTVDEERVTLILEFQNNGATSFRGLNGIVYPGTRFYLIGYIEPKENATNDYERRVFTQDYTTTVGVTVQSLSKAYNVAPDILKPHMEVGVQLTPQWTMATPTSVALN